MPFQITEATREKLKLRLAITGPSGAGKSWTAMMLAQRIAERENTRFCVIDTEHGSAKLYASLFTVNGQRCGHIDFGAPFSPDRYIEAIEVVEEAGYGVLVIDSLSHAWSGEGGALQLVDELGANGRGGKFASGWGAVTPMQNRMIEAMLQSPLHVIATMRSKQEHAMDPQTKTVTKLGMAPVQRDGVDYEFAIVLDMDVSQRATVSKSRCSALPMGKVIVKPKADLADSIMSWLDEGETPEPTPPAPQRQPEAPAVHTNGNGATPPKSDAQIEVSRFWAKAKEAGFASKSAVHTALGLPVVDGALASWAAEPGNSYDRALDALKLGIPVVKASTEPTAASDELDRVLSGGQETLDLGVSERQVAGISARGSH